MKSKFLFTYNYTPDIVKELSYLWISPTNISGCLVRAPLHKFTILLAKIRCCTWASVKYVGIILIHVYDYYSCKVARARHPLSYRRVGHFYRQGKPLRLSPIYRYVISCIKLTYLPTRRCLKHVSFQNVFYIIDIMHVLYIVVSNIYLSFISYC